MRKILILVILAVMFLPSFVLAAEEAGDLKISGLEAEKLLNLGSGLLATALFIVTFAAYKRTKRKRMIYISIAFLLFAVKGFLTSHDLFFEEWLWVDTMASILNFAIILSFFFGVLKK